MRKPLVAGNWKMNGSQASVDELLGQLTDVISGTELDCDTLVCPPAIFLRQAQQSLSASDIILAGQNLNNNEAGAYTGEVSGDMLKEHGCEFVLVGHSERRSLYSETNSQVAEKFVAALNAGLKPILCIGETREERLEGRMEKVVREQLEAVLDVVQVEDLHGAVIAYEPVWAIGTGETATPEQAEAVHELIRNRLADADKGLSESMRLLYGGSVNQTNAAALFGMPNIDGALVGGASLQAETFSQIITAAIDAAKIRH